MFVNSIGRRISSGMIDELASEGKLRELEDANEQMTGVKTVGGGLVVTRD
jgi:hypothetical protein